MTLSTLRFVRFFAPAVISVVLGYALLKMLRMSSVDVPINVNDLGYNLGYLILAAIYDFLPLRDIAYRPFREDIEERIRARLVAIAGLTDDPARFTWQRVRNVFYSLVDNDKSLEKRAERVMFNGAMMTCFADLTAIAFLFLIACLVMLLFGIPAGRPAILLVAILAVSLTMQWLAKQRHLHLGTDQLDYIEQQLKSTVQAKMAAL